MNKGKFQFSAKAAQRAEAIRNLRESREMLDKRVPQRLKEELEESGTKAGACFRNVSRILSGRATR